MDINEGIKYALTGNALLFCGSGFSVGSVSVSNNKLPTGSGLCNLLKKKLNIDDDDDDDLGYYSDKYVQEFGEEKLIRLLKDNFTINTFENYHSIIANIDWRRIYTTNYDNLIEKAGYNFNRKSVTLSSEPRKHKNHKELIIHLNGNLENLDSQKISNEFKLTNTSYSSTDFIESSWYEVFKNDIDSSKAIFFIGFSLKNDLDIRRAISSKKDTRNKSFFIDNENITSKNEDILSNYGKVLKIGVKGFAEKLSQASSNYIKPCNYKDPLYVFEEYDKVEPDYQKVTDKDIIDLLCRGEYSNKLLVHNNNNELYVFKRKAVTDVLKLIDEGKKVIILESDFGNGKTCTMNILQYELNKLGHVFNLINSDEDINNDIDIILNKYDGRKFLFIDNYHNYFNVLNSLDKYDLSESVLILSERSYINDLLYHDLLNINQINENNTSIITLNKLCDKEIESLIRLLNKYNLWGKKSKYKFSDKKKYIKKTCGRCLKDVLISRFNSSVIKNKLESMLEVVKKDKEMERIMLMSIITNLINLDLKLDDYLYFLSLTEIGVKIKKDKNINELLDIDNNEIKIKSSILADFIISSSKYSDKIVDLLIIIMNKLDNKNYTKKYLNVKFDLISFSNIQLLIKEKGDKFNNLIIRYYENIKNNRYCNKNIFFWIQYANARISLKQFTEAKLCLDKAASEKKCGKIYPQYETCYSRYLLENQLYNREYKNSYEVFEKAHIGIYNNKNTKDRWHFPLKYTNLYYDYYVQFYKTFSTNEKKGFIYSCQQIRKKIEEYQLERYKIDGKINRRVANASKKINFILDNYEIDDEVATCVSKQ